MPSTICHQLRPAHVLSKLLPLLLLLVVSHAMQPQTDDVGIIDDSITCFHDVTTETSTEDMDDPPEEAVCEIMDASVYTVEDYDSFYKLSVDVSVIDPRKLHVDLSFDDSSYGRLSIMGHRKQDQTTAKSSKSSSSPAPAPAPQPSQSSSSSSSSPSSSPSSSVGQQQSNHDANCIYRVWQIETDKSQDNYVDILDVTMGMSAGILSITAPKPRNMTVSHSPTSISDDDDVPRPQIVEPATQLPQQQQQQHDSMDERREARSVTTATDDYVHRLPQDLYGHYVNEEEALVMI